METLKEYYYTYYSYEEWGRGYFGSRKCRCLPKEDVKYLGSSKDKTFKPKYKIILKDDYSTREEAYADEIILQQYYKVVENPHFANKAYQTSTKFYVPTEQARELAKNNPRFRGDIGGKIGGKVSYERKVGVHARSKEKIKEDSRKGGTKTKERGRGIFSLSPEQRIQNSIKGGNIGGHKCKELGKGMFALSPEEKKKHAIKNSKKGGEKTKENKSGIFTLTKEQLQECGRKTSSQRWVCLETGYISTPSGLSSYQKARSIDTSRRKRIN
jgi:hypothetical protein